jgi:Fic family protein
MSSGRYETDQQNRRHFRPHVPQLPRLDDVADILLPATETLKEFDRQLLEFGETGISGRLFARLDAVHSSGAEGSTTTFTELMDFAVRPEAVPSPVEAEEVAACADAIDDMGARPVDTIDAILQLHKRLFEKAPDRFKAESAGRLKTHANATWDDTQPDGWFRYTLPASLPNVLADWRTFTMETSPSVPELVRQACSHWMFEHIHPVQDGNGRIGRLFIPLIGKWKGMTKTACAFIGEAVHEQKDHYIDGLKAARLANDVTPFVRICLSFVQQNATSNLARIDRMKSLQTQWRADVAPSRSDSAIHKILPWIAGRPVFTVRMIASDLNISFAAANEAVRKLVEFEIVVPSNQDGRNRVFRVPAVLDIFDRFRKPGP